MGTNNILRKRKPRRKRRNKNKNLQLQVNRPPMEDLIVNAKEHKILKKFRKWLENSFKVQIRMPKTHSLDSDIIFVSIQGEEANRNFVKKFLSEKMNTPNFIQSQDKGDADLITLSDSENDSSSDESEDISIIDLTSEDNLKSDVNVRSSNDNFLSVNKTTLSSSNIKTTSNKKGTKRKLENPVNSKVKKFPKVSSISEAESSGKCEVTSTTDSDMVSPKANLSESVLIIEESAASSNPVVDFIPLQSDSKSMSQKNEHTNKNSCLESMGSHEMNNDDIIILDEPAVASRRLRPIVIDGSNIAMEHGRASHCFSVKGIKLAIDYFLNRGHSQVTAFVPKFRRHVNPNRMVPTTDAEIFAELEKKQLVVFTPSRRIGDKCISSYDDRFVVQLAVSNGGVIVSNDNFRDLINESESFKEAIEQRLLMYCFAGDVFMVPEDPLGRNGPSLSDFLSFPSENKETEKKSST